MPLGTAVMVLLGFSGFVGYTYHSGCLLRGMNLYPFRVFLSFTYCTASQSGRTSQLITQYGSGGNQIFQSSRASMLGSWQVLLDPGFGFGQWNGGVICQWSPHVLILSFRFVHRWWRDGVPFTVWVSVGLGWVSLMSLMTDEVVESAGGVPMSSSLASGKAFPKPLKTSCLLNVVYFPMHCLNSLMHIAKGQSSPGTDRLASSSQYCSACT